MFLIGRLYRVGDGNKNAGEPGFHFGGHLLGERYVTCEKSKHSVFTILLFSKRPGISLSSKWILLGIQTIQIDKFELGLQG